eukprot:3526572-Pyramimonas_sp.AAC.1
MPALLYGVKAHGEPPSAITQARRRYMSGIAKARPGRCTTSFLSLVGKDPALQIPRAQSTGMSQDCPQAAAMASTAWSHGFPNPGPVGGWLGPQ